MNRKTVYTNVNLYILISILIALCLLLLSYDNFLAFKVAVVIYTIIFSILLFFWIWMLIDCVTRPYYEFHTENMYMKLVWFIVIIFGNLLGAILYYNLVKRKDYLQTEI